MEFIGKHVQPTKRLDWDEYFMCIAFLASLRSPCQRLNVGSVIVKDKRLIAMGYNGFLPSCQHKSIVRDGHEQAVVHSEINALSDCARRGVSIQDASIYITHFPCIHCFRALVASGIKEIIFTEDYRNDPLVRLLAEEAMISLRRLL